MKTASVRRPRNNFAKLEAWLKRKGSKSRSRSAAKKYDYFAHGIVGVTTPKSSRCLTLRRAERHSGSIGFSPTKWRRCGPMNSKARKGGCCSRHFLSLCSLYRRQVHSPQAFAFMNRVSGPLRVSTFLLLEFRQSTRLQVRLHSPDKTKGFSKIEAGTMLQQLQSDLAAGVLEIVPADWPDVRRIAERLSAASARKPRGHRLTDIFHVATALHLGAAEFLTFDGNQESSPCGGRMKSSFVIRATSMFPKIEANNRTMRRHIFLKFPL